MEVFRAPCVGEGWDYRISICPEPVEEGVLRIEEIDLLRIIDGDLAVKVVLDDLGCCSELR